MSHSDENGDNRLLVHCNASSEAVPLKFPGSLAVPPEIAGEGHQLSADALMRRSEPQARGFLTRELAFELRALPLQLTISGNQRVLWLAIAVEDNLELRQRLAFATGLSVQLLKIDAGILDEVLQRAYLGDEQRFLTSASDLLHYGNQISDKEIVPVESLSDTNEVTRFVSCLIEYAIAHKASDVHISARSGGSFVQLRIAGELRQHSSALSNLEAHRQIVSRIKVLAQMDITERNIPQDGRISYRLKDRVVDMRVSTIPAISGENVVLRIFGLQSVPRLDTLGFNGQVSDQILWCIQRCSGAVVIAGATGSGKTTTLYSIVEETKRACHAISTIEDPVEIVLDGVAQTSIDDRAGFGFAEALRAVLRQDPDVILVGEMRENRAATAAFDAALSGHLVLSTIHGGSVIEALMRFEQLGLSRVVVAQALNLLIAQRLVRRLCDKCRVFDLRAANSIGCDVYRAVGCAECAYSGYSGRVLIVEALAFNERIREFFYRNELITRCALAEVAGARFWQFREQLLLSLERGEIGYGQYLEMV